MPRAVPRPRRSSRPGMNFAGQHRPRAAESLGSGATHGLGEVVADPHWGASEASRLLAAVATPPSAVVTPFTVLVLGWSVRSETAVLSVLSADFTALAWALNSPCSSAVSAV